jgi:hypothetical protein
VPVAGLRAARFSATTSASRWAKEPGQLRPGGRGTYDHLTLHERARCGPCAGVTRPKPVEASAVAHRPRNGGLHHLVGLSTRPLVAPSDVVFFYQHQGASDCIDGLPGGGPARSRPSHSARREASIRPGPSLAVTSVVPWSRKITCPPPHVPGTGSTARGDESLPRVRVLCARDVTGPPTSGLPSGTADAPCVHERPASMPRLRIEPVATDGCPWGEAHPRSRHGQATEIAHAICDRRPTHTLLPWANQRRGRRSVAVANPALGDTARLPPKVPPRLQEVPQMGGASPSLMCSPTGSQP